MARHYGFTCDRCGLAIPRSEYHSILTTIQQLTKDKFQYDICSTCLDYIIKDFTGIGRPYELEFNKSV